MPHTALFYRRALIALAAAVVFHGCSGSPVRPTPPPPPPVPDAPKISCPAPVLLRSPLGSPIPVAYGTPTVVGGAPPVTSACLPASGSVFPVGPTAVTCTATDQQARADSCTFTIAVTAPPRVSATSYVAFGDSMTAGEVVSGRGYFRTLRVEPDKAYPTVLEKDLDGYYTAQAQAIMVDNQGRSGETAVQGASRLRNLLFRSSYEVLTLMEGANDLADQDVRTAQQGLAALRSMVREAKGRGVRVFLATLPPQNPNGCCPNRGQSAPLVPPFNDGIRGIASAESVPLVDVYEAFNGDITTLIDVDGLHPTPAGYEVIAETFFKSIKQELQEQAPSSFSSPFQPAPLFVRPRRR